MQSGSTTTVERYLERLPNGLDSYPEYVCKASIVRAFQMEQDLERLAEALPEALRPLADPQTAVTAWVPEVHINVMMLTRRALFFDSDEALIEDAYRRNRELLESPLYRMLTKFFSADRIGKMAAVVFNKLHRGIELEVQTGTPHHWTLRYPPHLLPEILARCMGTAATAALELGGTDVETVVTGYDAEHFEMEIHLLEA